LGRYSQPNGGLLGLAAGLIAVLATAGVANQVMWDSSMGAGASLAWAAAGALATWLLWRHQAQAILHKGKESGKHTPPDLEGQAEEGALARPKDSGKDFGVMPARAGSWIDVTQADRYILTSMLCPLLQLLLCSRSYCVKAPFHMHKLIRHNLIKHNQWPACFMAVFACCLPKR